MSINKVNMESYWSDDIENVLESIRHNATIMSDHHKKNYAYYKEQLKYYKIPVIIIAGINSVVSVGLQPYMDQGAISAATCLLSLVCGIIGSIELFLRISDGQEIELAASKDFYLLSINIYKTLSLERCRRHEGGKEYLEHVYNTYTKLIEDAQVINTKIRDKLSEVPIAGGKPKPISTSPVNEKVKETRSGLNIRNTLFGSRKKQPPSEDLIVDKLFQRMTASAHSPSITPPPNSDVMQNMMRQFTDQSNAMTLQMREMQSLIPKTSKDLVEHTLSDLKNKGSDIAGLAVDVGNTVKFVIEDAKNESLDEMEEGLSAFSTYGDTTKHIISTGKEARRNIEASKEVVKDMKQTGNEVVKDMKQTGKEVVKEVKQTGKEVVKDVKQTGNEVVKDVKQTGNEVVKDMKQTGKEVVKEVKQTGKEVVKEVKQTGK